MTLRDDWKTDPVVALRILKFSRRTLENRVGLWYVQKAVDEVRGRAGSQPSASPRDMMVAIKALYNSMPEELKNSPEWERIKTLITL